MFRLRRDEAPAWKLCSTMRAEDVTDTLGMALTASGCDQVHVRHKRRLLSDNGPSYIAGELAEYIEAQTMNMSALRHSIPRAKARSSAGIGP